MKTFTSSITYKNIKHDCVHLITTSAHHAYWCAHIILKKRWADINKPEVEDIIWKHAGGAHAYTLDVLGLTYAQWKLKKQGMIDKSH